MKSDWKRYYISDLGKVITGKTPKTSNLEYYGGDIPFLTPSDDMSVKYVLSTSKTITEAGKNTVKNAVIPKNSICVSCIGSDLGKVVITTRDTVTNQQINSVIVNTELFDIDFVYYAMVILGKILNYHSKTSTAVPIVNKSTFSQYKILCPELSEQKRIAKILSYIDDKVSLNTAINENLEQQAQAIFKSWFVDFDPFGGVMPEDWKVGTFSDIIESTLGGDWGKETLTGNYTEKVYCIRGADIPEVKSGNKGKMPTRYILPKNYKNKKLVADDIVVEISGGSPTQSTGRVTAVSKALLDRYDSGMVCTNFCRAIKPKKGYSNFIYYYWQYLYDSNVFFSYENGTTGIKNLDISGFVGTEPITIPPTKAIEKFNSIIESFFSQIFENGQENERLAALRDTLLPKLMNGEIDVENVKI